MKIKDLVGYTPGQLIAESYYESKMLKEEESDYYRDYQNGLISYEEYKDLVRQFQGRSGHRHHSSHNTQPVMTGMYFYNVKPGEEDAADLMGVKKTKSGKWALVQYNTSGHTFNWNKQRADQRFGTGKFWSPKKESVAEEYHNQIDITNQDYEDHLDRMAARRFDRTQRRVRRHQGSHVAGVDIERWLIPYQMLLKNDFQPVETKDRFEYLMQVALKLKGANAGFSSSTGMSNAAKTFNLQHDEQQLVAKLVQSAPKVSEIERYKKGNVVDENMSRKTDSHGRTQQEWLKVVKANHPDAKIMQAKMIDGPVHAHLADGRKLSWIPAEQGLAESATAGATSSANIGTVDAPHISPGKARGKKSYTGSVATGSGTKSPPQPVVKQPKKKDGTAVNGLDIKGSSVFGGPANEATVIKRR
jgi:hypothetical protein